MKCAVYRAAVYQYFTIDKFHQNAPVAILVEPRMMDDKVMNIKIKQLTRKQFSD